MKCTNINHGQKTRSSDRLHSVAQLYGIFQKPYYPFNYQKSIYSSPDPQASHKRQPTGDLIFGSHLAFDLGPVILEQGKISKIWLDIEKN